MFTYFIMLSFVEGNINKFMLIFCPIDRLRLSKSDDTYGGVSHTTIVSEEMVHEFSCK
jgi:hypothetical protein